MKKILLAVGIATSWFIAPISAQTDKTSYYTIGDTTRIETPIRKNRGTAAAL